MNDLDPKKQGAAATSASLREAAAGKVSSRPGLSRDRHSLNLDRLLRSAAEGREDVAAAMPFGFDTRVIALWRANTKTYNGLTPLLRRIALLSAVIIGVSTIGAVREAGQSRKVGESFTNEFAIADSAIQDEFSP